MRLLVVNPKVTWNEPFLYLPDYFVDAIREERHFHKIFKYHGGREKLEIARVHITKSYSANIENTKTQKYTTPKIQKYIELAP